MSLIARRGATTALTAAANKLFDADLPAAPRWVAGRNANLIWNGLGHWLIESPQHTLEPDAIATEFATCASVVEQTDSRIMLDVSGPRVRDTLAKGMPIDLHHSRFQVGDVALTSVSHINVQIWQIHRDPVYRLSVPRSYFASFARWLAASAAEYGYDVSASP